jgi:hypothetical protein
VADNIPYTPGSGVLIAADDVGGVLHERVKIVLGADGAATDWQLGQQTAAQSAPVVLASDRALPVPNTAIACVAVSVGSGAEVALPTSPLANRRRLIVQNRSGSVSAFLGPTGVTSANGLELGPYAERVFELGPSVILYGRTSSGTADVRVLELS